MSDDTKRMTPGCAAVRPRLEGLATQSLSAGEEAALRSHLHDCASCRSFLAAIDPAALFLELRRAPLPDNFWDGFDVRLRTRLEAEAASPFRPLRALLELLAPVARAPRLALLAAPLAMVLLLGMTVLVTRPGGLLPGRRDLRGPQGLRSPYASSADPRRDGPGVRSVNDPLRGSGTAALLAAEPPPLEEIGSPGARVYRLDVAGDGGTPIYMVVDETINF